MGFINIEKEGNRNTVPSTNSSSNSYYRDDSLNLLNNNTNDYNYNFSADNNYKQDRLKTEKSLVGTCLSTFFKVIIIVGILALLLYLGIRYLDSSITLFPQQDSYSNQEFNNYLKRCMLIMFGALSFICFITMIIINGNVRSQFRHNYLNKISIYIYDFFLVLFNIFVYVMISLGMFMVVDDLHNDFTKLIDAGKIAGEVNIDIINIFKYVIVSIIAIFIVLNTFSAIGIVHKKNKFVFENEV